MCPFQANDHYSLKLHMQKHGESHVSTVKNTSSNETVKEHEDLSNTKGDASLSTLGKEIFIYIIRITCKIHIERELIS